MSDLTEFLLARIAEDEVAATAILGGARRWGKATARFRLAECQAKRGIVTLHRPYGPDAETCTICTETGPDAQGWPCDTIRHLATPYADHPNYQQEWRP